jgi:hypothetical protein
MKRMIERGMPRGEGKGEVGLIKGTTCRRKEVGKAK